MINPMTKDSIVTKDLKENSSKIPTEYQSLYNSLPEYQKKGINCLTGRTAIMVCLKELEHPTSIEDDVRKQAEELSEKVLPRGKGHQGQLNLFSPYPTDLCRISPFHPLSKKEMKKREYVENMTLGNSSWGSIVYRGIKLSTYHEDLLIAILAAIYIKRQRTELSPEIGEKRVTFIYRGPFAPILRLKGIKGNPGNDNYKQAIKQLDDMVACSIHIITSGKNTRGKKIEKKGPEQGFNMISFYNWDQEAKEISITINPYFYNAIDKGRIEPLSLIVRADLGSPVAKQLYSFVASHQSKTWIGPWLILATAINMNMTLGGKGVKRALKTGFYELIRKGILDKRSFLKKSTISLILADKVKKKALKK